MVLQALIVGASPYVPSQSLLRELAEGSQFVVAVDGGAETLTAADLQPDLLVGDADSVPRGLVEYLASEEVEVIIHPALKDSSDLRLALKECARRSVDRIIAVGVSGGRFDHTLAALGVLADYSSLRPEIHSDSESVWILAEDGARDLALSGEGLTFSVVALEDRATVSVEGAQWPLQHAALSPLSDLGLSNVISGGPATIVLEEGCALVIAPKMPNGQATRMDRR